MKKSLSIFSISLIIITSVISSSYAGSKKLKRAIAIGAAIGVGAAILKNIKKKNKRKNRKSASKKSNRSPKRTVNRSANAAIQKALNAKGYNAGTPDGVLGKGSRAAISSYQRSVGAKPTGKLTKAQRAGLLGVATVAGATVATTGTSIKSDVHRAQENLSRLDYNVGTIDGVMGKKSREKLRQFQVDYDLPPTRKLSPEVMQLLESEANSIDLAQQIRSLPDTEVTVDPKDAKSLYPVCRLSRKFGNKEKAPIKECGYVDENGNWAIYPKYIYTSEFFNGHAVVRRSEEKGEPYILISKDGQEVNRQPHRITNRKESPYHIVCNNICTVIKTDKLEEIFETKTNYLFFVSPNIFIERIKPQDGEKLTNIYIAESKEHKVINLQGEIYENGILNSNDIILLSYETKNVWIQDLHTGKIKWKGQFEESPENLCDGLLGIRPPSGDSYLLNSVTYKKIALGKGNVGFKSLYTEDSTARRCDENIVLKYSDKHVLFNISTGSEIASGYEIIPHILDDKHAYIVKKAKDGSSKIINSNGDEIFPSHDNNLAIFYDKYIVSYESDRKSSIHQITNGNIETILNNAIGDHIDKVTTDGYAEPKFKFRYGDTSKGISTGEYVINPDGSSASQGGLLEASTYQQACIRAIGKSSKKFLPLLQTCSGLMYSKLDENTSTLDPEAHYSYFHFSLYSGYFSGPEDYKKELTKTAEIGSIRAQSDLSFLYFKGNKELELKRDDNLGVYWAYRAAEQGHANSQNNLGVAYLNGRGVEKDLDKALYWFKNAAEQGQEDSIHDAAVVERHLRAQNQPRQSRGLTFGDIIRTVGRNAPSEAKLQNQRDQRQCKKSVRNCLASCANIPPPANMQFFGKSPRQKCEASCGRGSC